MHPLLESKVCSQRLGEFGQNVWPCRCPQALVPTECTKTLLFSSSFWRLGVREPNHEYALSQTRCVTGRPELHDRATRRGKRAQRCRRGEFNFCSSAPVVSKIVSLEKHKPFRNSPRRIKWSLEFAPWAPASVHQLGAGRACDMRLGFKQASGKAHATQHQCTTTVKPL